MQSTKKILDGDGNKAMNVDGSVTPVVYTFAPEVATEIVSLTCVLDGAGSSIFSGFTETLTNGILIQETIGDVTQTLALIKDKSDLIACFNSSYAEPLSSSSFIGSFFSAPNAPLILNPGDSLMITVQDDLTPIGTLNMTAMVIS